MSKRQALHTDSAPKAIGPYSQGIEAAGQRFLFLSGQIPLDPQTGELVPGDIAAQTERVIQNLKAVLSSGGATLDNIVRCTIFLTDLGDFAKVNDVYGRHFAATPPARTTVQVSALPKGARVEIDAIAVL
jgi:2-iminobutanoate/2-iminopropanoate deaminase